MRLNLAHLAALIIGIAFLTSDVTRAQGNRPTMLVPDLAIRDVVGDLVTPTAMAFIGRNDFLVLEKNTVRLSAW
jgi:hypothetical protein